MHKASLPQRKRLRVKGYDYALPGTYFATICADGKKCTLGYVDGTVGQGLCPCRLSTIGMIVDEEARRLPERFPTIAVDRHVVMPNHVHLLLSFGTPQSGAESPSMLDRSGCVGQGLCPCRRPEKAYHVERQGQSPCPTKGDISQQEGRPSLSDVVGAFKSLTTKRVNTCLNTPGRRLWQPRFHEHIVRGEKDYEMIWQYIENNPVKWNEDAYFPPQEG